MSEFRNTPPDAALLGDKKESAGFEAYKARKGELTAEEYARVQGQVNEPMDFVEGFKVVLSLELGPPEADVSEAAGKILKALAGDARLQNPMWVFTEAMLMLNQEVPFEKLMKRNQV